MVGDWWLVIGDAGGFGGQSPLSLCELRRTKGGWWVVISRSVSQLSGCPILFNRQGAKMMRGGRRGFSERTHVFVGTLAEGYPGGS